MIFSEALNSGQVYSGRPMAQSERSVQVELKGPNDWNWTAVLVFFWGVLFTVFCNGNRDILEWKWMVQRVKPGWSLWRMKIDGLWDSWRTTSSMPWNWPYVTYCIYHLWSVYFMAVINALISKMGFKGPIILPYYPIDALVLNPLNIRSRFNPSIAAKIN